MSDDLSLDARLLRFRSDPGAEPCHELSAALLDARRSREALEVLSRGLSLRDDDVRLLRLAARAFLAEGDILRAQQTLTRVIRSHPADVEAYRLLAETLLQRGDVGRAQAAVAKALTLAPDDTTLRAMRDRLGTAAPAGPAVGAPAMAAASPASEVVAASEVAAESEPASHAGPEPQPAPQPEPGALAEPESDSGPLSVVGAVAEAVAEAEAVAGSGGVLGDREELTQDVTRLLAQAMKTASTRPPPLADAAPPAPVTRASARPQPSPGLPVAPLPARVGDAVPAATAAPVVTAAPAVTAAPEAPAAPAVPATPEVPAAPVFAASEVPATPAVPAAPVPAPPVASAGAPPVGRPGPRRSPTLMGFAPPRPPARPASVPPPARSAPLPAIRPPSVRPPGAAGLVPPPNFAPPAMPLPAVAPAPAPLPLATAAPVAEPAPPPVRTAPEQEEEDEPTSFMDRESLAGALGVPMPRRESKRPAPAATSVPVGGPVSATPGATRAPAVPLPDTLPEFVVPNLPDAPTADAPKRGDALRVPARAVAATPGTSASAPHAEPVPTDAAAETPAPRPRRSGRAALVVLVALLLALGGGFAAHRADVLPPAWSTVIDQRWGALVGGPRTPEPVAEPTPPVAPDASSPVPEPPVDPAAAQLAALDAALAEGRVPADLPEDDQPESVRLRAEAALLSATPWWSVGPAAEGRASLDAVAAQLTAAVDAQATPEPTLRATALRVAAARGDSDVLASARALAAEHPEDPHARWALAEALMVGGEAAEADALLAALVDAGPPSVRARAAVQRAWLAAGRGDHATARAALDAARALAPDWELVQLRSLDLRLDAGEYRAVLAELGDAPDTEARVLRALRAQLGLEQLDASEALWARLPDTTRQRPDVLPLAANYFMARGEPGEAVRALADLALAEPGDPTLIALYASALYEAGQTLVASAQFERAIALDESHPEALIGFSQVLLRARKYREARINLDRAEAGLRGRVRPPATLARLRVMRARIMVEERELTQAAVLLRRTLEIEGAPSEGWFYLGEALARSNSPESRAAYERYLSLSPVGPLASRARRAIQ